MTRIVRGFSSNTGYSCLECHSKCCATEYKLPLLPQELTTIKQKYLFCDIFIHTSSKGDWLLRGDKCPFLNPMGICILHNTQDKPLICQIYPLIFWKVKSNQILTWIYPCRGNGFRWVADPENRILNQEIELYVDRSKSHFNEYLGEQIDNQNPFKNISMSRFDEELAFFDRINSFDLLDEINKMDLIPNSIGRMYLDIKDPTTKEITLIINTVIHWLCWSPVGLQLSFYNSKLLFFVAATWIVMVNRPILSQTELYLSRDQILQQLGSFLATAISPLFWEQMVLKTKHKKLGKFAKKVIKVLKGEIVQEKLSI